MVPDKRCKNFSIKRSKVIPHQPRGVYAAKSNEACNSVYHSVYSVITKVPGSIKSTTVTMAVLA